VFRASPTHANVEFLRDYAGGPVPEGLELAIDLALDAAGGTLRLVALAERAALATGFSDIDVGWGWLEDARDYRWPVCVPLHALTELVDNASYVSSVHVAPSTNVMRIVAWRGDEKALDQLQRVQGKK